jgi:TonB family protein
MRAALVFLAIASASAQTDKDARRLLEAISKTARSASSLRVEGSFVRETTGDRGTNRQDISFEVATQGPLQTRVKIRDRTASMLQTCDGTYIWNYDEVANSYGKSAATFDRCNPPVARWRDLMDYLVGAKLTGHDHSEFEGRSQECEVIEAAYETPRPLLPGVPSAGRLRRVLCVDSVQHLVLREGIEVQPGIDSTGAAHYSMAITYSRIELNPAFTADVFQFDPPPGSQQTSAVDRPSPPVLISKREPKYSPEALKAKLQGTVLVSLLVGEDGVPQNVKVVRGLGLGLDEKAIEAVQGWRFKPAMKGGEPIAVPAQVEVNFKVH